MKLWPALLIGALAVAPTTLSLTPSTAQAKGYGMAGCGLGSMLFRGNGKTQILASTTNAMAFQSFAITSGTSNCTNLGIVKRDKEQEAFAELNYDHLARESAQGGGSHLAAMATLMGCAPGQQGAFFEYTQSNFEHLYTEEGPLALVVGLRSGMSVDPQLSSCSRI